FLIALAFCGWGCSGGAGAFGARRLYDTNAPSFCALTPGAGCGLTPCRASAGACTGAQSSAPPPPPNIAPANTVSLFHFGNAGFGGDDTNVFQTALNFPRGNGQTPEIPAGSYNINPLSFPNNANVFVDTGVTVTA